MDQEIENYPLEAGSASFKMIRRYAKQLVLTRDDAVLLRSQLRIELTQHELGITHKTQHELGLTRKTQRSSVA